MALIEATNLHKVFPDGTKAVRGISLSIQKGEFVAIMGPSGSGKSTLLHMLGLLDSSTEGTYILDGHDVATFGEDTVAHVRNTEFGFVFQTFNLLGRTSALENVKLPLLYSDSHESSWNTRAQKVLSLVGLSHRMDHEPARLSGGEKQRVAIARALVVNPQIIFADEPTGNLDSKTGAQIMEILTKLHGEGHTIILITHEPFIAAYAKRIVTIKDGRIFSDVHVKEGERKK